MNIDFSKVTPVSELQEPSSAESTYIVEYLKEAEAEVNQYAWNDGIKQSYFGIGEANVYAVFLFEIIPGRDDVDDFLWVIVGDLPTAYITCEEAPNPACALDGYIGAMEQWIDAAFYGTSLEGIFPVKIDANLSNAKQLRNSLDYLDENVLIHYKQDLKC
ncbi:MAG: hypothetical protein ACJAQ6_001799 [Arenicella sp.]